MGEKAFFPAGYPDEDFRSMLFRYKSRVGAAASNSFQGILIDFFESTSHYPSIYPSNLSLFVEKTNYFMTAEDIIFNHTFFPLYYPFLPSDLEKLTLESMLYKKKNNHAGTYLISLYEKNYKFCPQCLISDTTEFGESYIHRVHQFEFVHICPLHSVYLIKSCPFCNQLLADFRNLYQPTSDTCPHCRRTPTPITTERNEVNTFLYDLAIDCITLLQATNHPQAVTKHKYDTVLWLKGYLMGEKKKYKNKDIYKDLISYYKLDDLGKIGVTEEYLSKRISFSYGGAGEKNPLINLLLMRFLYGSAEGFINYELPVLESPLYWGHGPWECINPFCESFNVGVITRCRTDFSSHKGRKRLYASFICPNCGCKYAKYTDTSDVHIVDHGDLFRETLISAADSKEDLTQIAGKLGKTVRYVRNQIRYAKEMDLQGIKHSPPSSDPFRDIKEKIVELVMNDNTLKRNEIASIIGKKYYKLIKEEPDWVNNNVPSRKKESYYNSINWPTADERLSKEITRVVDELYRRNHPRRILPYTILGQLSNLDKKRIANNKEKLPMTVETLEKLTESYEAYQIRRIPIAANLLIREQRAVSLSNFLKYALPFQDCSITVQNHITRFINEMQEGKNNGQEKS
ncbi:MULTISPECIES: TnsD family Tn7-like transposition protein [Paenibacillus]|uniref:TnsD family Tn7-like transposition protein n=1 Tax=Paenibacillus TaxID=44249 RepID=UPI0004B7BA45|nr:TnsD family Tn7-like transposition protein [Paenibacillus sp. IHBB 10380]